MNQLSILLRSLLVVVVASCALTLPACSEDETDSPVVLHYQSVGDIGPGMPYRGAAPTYRGAAPSEFALEAITLDGTPFTDENACFALDPNDGFLIIANSYDLPLGTYRFTVSCRAGGGRCTFRDAFAVRMVAATPERIVVTPSELRAGYDEDRVAWPTAQIAPADEAVSFNAYALVQEKGKEYFAVSNTGLISVNFKFEGTIPPGVYRPVLRLTTKAGTAEYADAVTIRVDSRPLGITYERNPGTAEIGAAFASDVPELLGSPDDAHYEILSVTPSTDQFSIDPATGVISLLEGHTLAANSSYEFSLAVSNRFSNGEAVALRGVYAVDVVPYIEPIDPETFAYAPVTMTEYCQLDAEKAAGFVGDVVTFSLGELPEALREWVSIDAQSGKISIPRRNTIPQGEYDIPVRAVNSKSDMSDPATATLRLTVAANPNMFYKFGYGNNLGLDAESHADQFRWEKGSGVDKTIALSEFGYNDFDGRTPTFKVDLLPGSGGTWVVESVTVGEDGTLQVKMKTSPSGRIGQIGYFRVTATLGEGETAVSRSTVVFVTYRDPAKSDQIEYTPYVHRINSRQGGYSDVRPVYGAGIDPAQVMIRWRQNCFLYEGLGTGETIYGGKLDENTPNPELTIYKLWGTYENSGTTNVKNSMPFSWYFSDGTKDSNANMSKKLGYFDPDNDNRIYIAPNKWLDEAGQPINGVFSFQASYSVTANPDDLGKTANVIGVAIWLDENF